MIIILKTKIKQAKRESLMSKMKKIKKRKMSNLKRAKMKVMRQLECSKKS